MKTNNRNSIKYNIVIIVLLGIVLLSLLLFLAWREDYWGDEGFTIRRIEAPWSQLYYPALYTPPENSDPFFTRDVYDFNPPLYFAFIRILTGPNPGRMVVRIFSIVPMIGIMIVLVLCGRRYYGLNIATILALIFCLSPPVIYYGHEARPYAWGMFLAMVAIGFFDKYSEQSLKSFAIHFAISLAGILLHYHFIWFLVAYGIYYSLQLFDPKREAKWRSILARIGGLVMGSALAFLIMTPSWRTFAQAKSLPSRPMSGETIVKTLFHPLVERNYSGRFQMVLVAVAICLFIALTGYMLINGLSRNRNHWRQGALWLILWLIPSLSPILAHLLFQQSFFERYSLFALPGWLMLIGWITHHASIHSRMMKYASGLLLITLIGNGMYWNISHLGHPFRSTWGPAIHKFLESEQPGDYYSVQPEWQRYCFFANADHRPQAIYDTLRSGAPAGTHRIWIIGSRQLNPDLVSRLRDWHIMAVEHGGSVGLWFAER